MYTRAHISAVIQNSVNFCTETEVNDLCSDGKTRRIVSIDTEMSRHARF